MPAEDDRGPYNGFNVPFMATDLTLDCAARFAADLRDPLTRVANGKAPGRGPRSHLLDTVLGLSDSRVLTPADAVDLINRESIVSVKQEVESL